MKNKALAMHTVEVVQIDSLEQLQPLVDIGCQAWLHDPIFAWLSPHRTESPHTYRNLWELILKSDLSQPGTVMIAAYSDLHGPSQECLGFAVWRRHGSSPAAQQWRSDSFRMRILRLEILLLHILQILSGRLPLKKAVNLQTANREVERLYPAERWRLCWLGVSPESQRCGIGSMLLRWGLARSEDESVPVVLEASKSGRQLYLKRGFEQVGWQRFDGGRIKQPVMIRHFRHQNKSHDMDL
ncbi:hypothetical protein Cob_v011277 [Colletotrichum orbiculare MAFF 240422]|uniref:N-acetyltransferase domain-containing protein n=1 Tax=Colletotrichum orbiculare (strain 104-T / ATCC 96160 / CBS 514.97 / LARS 414 / MAFF 240422) TaxID=1213857 RepID=A0A484FBV9_COLOR|nr:hypothetical protein Cob_v011277 [Colletotrichum orbiculare MAFF 240422]